MKFALALSVLLAACGSPDYHSLPRYEVNDILSAYQDNEAAAKEQYEGQQFVVTGEIEGIEAGGQSAVLETTLLSFLTEARAQYKNLEDLIAAEKGQDVALVCIGDGYAAQGLGFGSVLTGGEINLRFKNELRFKACFPLPSK